jgi:hypothetical protein
VCTLLGGIGQSIHSALDTQHITLSETPNVPSTNDNILQRLASSKWSPVKALSDEQYEELLQEKLLRVEAEIAVLDEHINALKKEVGKEPGRIANSD